MLKAINNYSQLTFYRHMKIKNNNNMEYTFTKDYGFFKAGDMLTWDNELNSFTMEVKDENSFRSAMLDKGTAEDMYEKGILSANESENDNVNRTVELIDKLLKAYAADYEDMEEKAKDGKIQPCVRVEAETVYYNLNKVLNKVREELTNE